MIVLPECDVPRGKILLPMYAREWRAPSSGQLKDQFGNENKTRWRIRARMHDGHVAWVGWFDDREDCDAFLWALARGSLQYERELWRLPNPWWAPDIAPDLAYEIHCYTFLVSPTGSNQTYTTPSDWNNVDNSIECIGGAGGGSGGYSGSGGDGGGGGGGAYSAISNLIIGSSATYRIGAQGPGGAATVSGTAGGDSWFNGATLGASSVGAKGGTGGTPGVAGTGGASASGVGTAKYSGGDGGIGISPTEGAGGGGAAGPNGAGNNASSPAGGAGDNGSGGAGGTVGNPGVAGTEFDGSHGCGGGGGGGNSGAGAVGGNYGGAGGGGVISPSNTAGGNGKQGLLVISYVPFVSGSNMPMLGM